MIPWTSVSTMRQRSVLRALDELTVDGVGPSLKELKLKLGASSVGQVHKTLVELKTRGLVTWEPCRSRTLRIVDHAPITREQLMGQEDEHLRQIASWCFAILAGRDR